MHICPHEINSIITGLPFLEHLTGYVKHGWRWLVARVMRHARKGR